MERDRDIMLAIAAIALAALAVAVKLAHELDELRYDMATQPRVVIIKEPDRSDT